MKHLSLFTILLIILFLFSSCRKFVEIPSPYNVVISGQVFSTDAKAISVLTGIYGYMINGEPSITNSMATIYLGFSSDELDEYNPALSEQEFIKNTLTAENVVVENLWSSIYKYIYYANAAIEGISQSEKLSPRVHSRLLGEAKFIRAFCYFYLVNLFGEVPLITNTIYENNAAKSRSSVSKIYEQIDDDLESAINLLPIDYPNVEPVRPNKFVAESLLARVSLHLKNWNKADSLCTDIINSHMYTLESNLKNVFLADSKEAMWQLVPTEGYIPEFGNYIYPFSAPSIVITKSLFNAFENGDLRKSQWIDSISYLNEEYYYPAKYRSLTLTNEEYYMIFRYAEIYLIRAESRIHENNILGAQIDLNIIRKRAGLGNILADNANDLLHAVMHERRIELFAEWGHRWLDLKRAGNIDSVLNESNPNWESYKQFYPMPSDQLKLDYNLTQNNGY